MATTSTMSKTAPASPLDVVRDVKLPATDRIYPRVEAIRDRYLLATGHRLGAELAVLLLDILLDERRGSR